MPTDVLERPLTVPFAFVPPGRPGGDEEEEKPDGAEPEEEEES